MLLDLVACFTPRTKTSLLHSLTMSSYARRRRIGFCPKTTMHQWSTDLSILPAPFSSFEELIGSRSFLTPPPNLFEPPFGIRGRRQLGPQRFKRSIYDDPVGNLLLPSFPLHLKIFQLYIIGRNARNQWPYPWRASMSIIIYMVA